MEVSFFYHDILLIFWDAWLNHRSGIFLTKNNTHGDFWNILDILILEYTYFIFLVLDILSIIIFLSHLKILVKTLLWFIGSVPQFMGSGCYVFGTDCFKRYRILMVWMVDLHLFPFAGPCLRDEECCCKGSTYFISFLYLETKLWRIWDFL